MENLNSSLYLRNKRLEVLKSSLFEEKNKGRLAFILGNGINRYNPNDLSWAALIKQAYAYCLGKDSPIPLEDISLTELYDMVTLDAFAIRSDECKDLNREMARISKNVKGHIRSKIIDIVGRKVDYHDWLQRKFAEWNVPVLTTNYDKNIESGMKQYVIPSSAHAKGFSDSYLFNVYYADKPIDRSSEVNFFNHFAVWHIHGRVNHLRSIRIGLSDYMNLLTATKDWLHNKAHLYNVVTEQTRWGMKSKEKPDPDYAFTWLNIFYNCSICINGLALNQDESYLRWLLISRKKYLERVGLSHLKGWYVCHPSDLTDGKRFFLEKTGLEVVELSDNRERYEAMFELKETDI